MTNEIATKNFNYEKFYIQSDFCGIHFLFLR